MSTHSTLPVSVVTICNHKGGTGKTTSSVHLAAAIGHSGRRVLVIDFDPQGFLTRTLGLKEPTVEASSLALLDADADLRTFPVESVSGFDVIGSSMGLTRALRRLTKPTDVFWLRETLAAGHDYDLILLDTAAALSVFTMNALVACDQVVIPVTPEYQPVVGAEQTWQTSRLVKSKLNPSLMAPRFLLTQVDARLRRHSSYAEYLREKYGPAVMQTAIRTSSSLATATRDGRTVYDARVTTRGAVDYACAAEEIGVALFDTPTPRPLLRTLPSGDLTIIDLHAEDVGRRVDAIPEASPAPDAPQPASPVSQSAPRITSAPDASPAPPRSGDVPVIRRNPLPSDSNAAAAADMLAQARTLAEQPPEAPAPGDFALAAAPLGTPDAEGDGAEGTSREGWTSLDQI